MGIFTDQVQYIASEKKLERLEKQKIKLEKQKQKEKNENLKTYKKEIEKFLYYKIDEKININYDDYILFYNKEYKKEILENFYNSIKKYDSNNILYIPFKSELQQYYYKIYDKILKQVKKENEQQQQYNNYILEKQLEAELLKEKQKENDQQKASEFKNIVNVTFIIILSIIFLPLVLLLGIIKRLHKFQQVKNKEA